MVGLLAVLLLLPFLQVGFSYWVACHVAAAASTILLTGRRNIVRLFAGDFHVRAVIMACMVISAAVDSGGDGANILRTMREAVCFFLIVGVSKFQVNGEARVLRPALNLVVLFACGELLLTLIQSYYLRGGTYFGIPQELFIINADTLPTELDLAFSDIRPMGSYGEPSYLSGVAFSLIFGLRHAVLINRKVFVASLLLTLTLLISRSLSGAVAVSVLWGAILFRSGSPKIIVGSVLLAAAGACFLILGFDFSSFDRINAIAEGNDVSFFVRVIAPVLAVPQLLLEYPMGIPFLKFMEMDTVLQGQFSVAQLIQNGFFNILINYGFFGFLIIGRLFISFRSPLSAFYLLILMFQNGSFLAFDKVALVGLAMILGNTIEAAQLSRNRQLLQVRLPVST